MSIGGPALGQGGGTATSPDRAAPDRWTLPIPVGLRAAAEEATTGRLKRALIQLAERLESGEPLEPALERAGARLPPFLKELLRGAARSANPARFFSRYIEQSRQTAELRRTLRLNILMPIFLMVSSLLLLLFVLGWIVPKFKSIFTDFGTALPGITKLVIEASDAVVFFLPAVLAAVGAITAVLALLLFGAGRLPGLQEVLRWIPVAGDALRRSALSDYCEYLALLVECRTPLASAVHLAADATGDRALARACRRFGAALARGEPADTAALQVWSFPPLLKSAFRHATDPETFCRVLEGQRDIYRMDGQSRSMLIPMVIGPAVMAAVGALIAFVVLALFLPLIKLLNDLS